MRPGKIRRNVPVANSALRRFWSGETHPPYSVLARSNSFGRAPSGRSGRTAPSLRDQPWGLTEARAFYLIQHCQITARSVYFESAYGISGANRPQQIPVHRTDLVRCVRRNSAEILVLSSRPHRSAPPKTGWSTTAPQGTREAYKPPVFYVYIVFICIWFVRHQFSFGCEWPVRIFSH